MLKGRWPLLLIVAAILASLGLAQTQQGHVILRNVGLYEPPAVYTELTLSNPDAPPITLAKPNGSVAVSFDVYNVSGTPRSYQWSIAFVHANKSQLKASGAVFTPAQGHAEVTKSLAAACTGGQLEVVVRLASQAEAVSFWVTCPPAAKKGAEK